jgi:hypothetical protein
MDKYASDLDMPWLNLIGKIKGQVLTLNYEGVPLPGSGVFFKLAYPIDHDGSEPKYVAKQIADVDKPIDIVQHKMAKYNFRAASLEFFDGSLQKVASGARVPFMDFSSLSTRPVEIIPSLKQTVSANQQLNHGREKKHRHRFRP